MEDDLKSIVVYYSLEGNTDFIARILAEKLGSDLLRLRPKKEFGKEKSFAKYFWGGKQVMMKEKPELEYYEFNIDEYGLIIIGTPIWAWSFTPPIRTFLSGNKIQGKKVALFCNYEGNFGKVFDDLKSMMGQNEYLDEKAFKDSLGNKKLIKNQIENWLKKITK